MKLREKNLLNRREETSDKARNKNVLVNSWLKYKADSACRQFFRYAYFASERQEAGAAVGKCPMPPFMTSRYYTTPFQLLVKGHVGLIIENITIIKMWFDKSFIYIVNRLGMDRLSELLGSLVRLNWSWNSSISTNSKHDFILNVSPSLAVLFCKSFTAVLSK